MIAVNCSLTLIVQDAVAEDHLLSKSHFSHMVTAAHEVILVIQNNAKNTNNSTNDIPDVQFTVVRPWLHYVLVELLKNVLATSMERIEGTQTNN